MEKLKLYSGIFARNPNLVKFIIIHCSATPRGRDVGAKEIRRWHLQRGFRDIGYHYVVRLDGSIEVGRPLGEAGAHCKGKNYCSVGICYVGGVESDGVTPADTRTLAQRRALAELIDELRKLFPMAEVVGHRDFAAKACPSFDARREYRGLAVAAIAVTGFVSQSCRSRKDTTVTTDYRVDTADRSHTLFESLYRLNDSVNLTIRNPEIEIKTPDSVVMTIRAGKIERTRKSDALLTTETAQRNSHNDVRTVGTVHTQHFETKPATGGGGAIGFVVGAVIALSIVVYYKIRNIYGK